jgi:hypothetical protein
MASTTGSIMPAKIKIVAVWKAGNRNFCSGVVTPTLAAIAEQCGFPRPACGERATLADRKPDLGAVRGRFHKLRLAERPPHPDLLHSPSQTGVNALMACGEKETAVLLGQVRNMPYSWPIQIALTTAPHTAADAIASRISASVSAIASSTPSSSI